MKGRWTPPTDVTLWASAFAGLITLVTGAYLASVYSSLPIGVPVQYDAGRPFIFQIKSPSVVMLPSIVQSSLIAVFGAVILLLLWRPRSVAHAVAARVDDDGRRMSLAAEGIALLAMLWITMQALGAAQLILLWRGAWDGFGSVYSMAMFAAIVASILVVLRTLNLVGRQRTGDHLDNPALWRMRQHYFNPRDPALFVPTRTGMGWTLNFGRPLAIVLLATTLAVGIGGPFVFARYVLRGFTLGLIGP